MVLKKIQSRLLLEDLIAVLLMNWPTQECTLCQKKNVIFLTLAIIRSSMRAIISSVAKDFHALRHLIVVKTRKR